MNVKELIAKLEKYPGHCLVVMEARGVEFDDVYELEHLTAESGRSDEDVVIVFAQD